MVDTYKDEAGWEKELEAVCARYLNKQPFTVFGEFTLHNEDNVKLAAKWLAKHFHGVYKEMWSHSMDRFEARPMPETTPPPPDI